MQTIYKGKSKSSGVYQITNTINGKVYIGSAKRFIERYKGHIGSLRNNKHRNKHLQSAFNKYGSDAFTFEVLEVVEGDKGERFKVEQRYLDRYDKENGWDVCYNFKRKPVQKERSCFSKDPENTKKIISKNSRKMWKNRSKKEKEKILNILKNSRTEKTYKKISKALTGRKLSKEHIENCRKANLGEKHHLFGKENKWGRHTEEAKRKIAAYQKGRKKSVEQIVKQSGKNHWTKKKRFSEETKQKMRASAQSRAYRIRAVSLETKKEYIFPSLREAERNLPVTKPNISEVLKGIRKSTKGFYFERF